MVYSLSYRRPAYTKPASISSSDRSPSPDESINSRTRVQAGIPAELSFDRIIAGQTRSPCTVREFLNYLVYVEHAAENLQFFLWYKDYCQRFFQLAETEQALAQPFVAPPHRPGPPRKTVSAEVTAVLADTDFSPVSGLEKPTSNPFDTPPSTPGEKQSVFAPSTRDTSLASSPLRSPQEQAAVAFDRANVKVQPFTIQPYREEITRIIATYIAEGGSRELNLSSKERASVLQRLAVTTHPTALVDVARAVEWALRRQAHPNFIRWSIYNCCHARITFCRGLGVFVTVAGLAIAILLTLSSVHRAYRLLSALALIFGISTLVSAWKGVCPIIYGLHHRHLYPWELFDHTEELEEKRSCESFDSCQSNSYEDEPWVKKYSRRNILRKIFDREVAVQEKSMRKLHDTISLQALIVATPIGLVIAGIFCAIPQGHFF